MNAGVYQKHFARMIISGSGITEGVPAGRLQPEDVTHVYADGYRIRLLESASEIFTLLKESLNESDFEELVFGFSATRFSHHENIARFFLTQEFREYTSIHLSREAGFLAGRDIAFRKSFDGRVVAGVPDIKSGLLYSLDPETILCDYDELYAYARTTSGVRESCFPEEYREIIIRLREGLPGSAISRDPEFLEALLPLLAVQSDLVTGSPGDLQ